LAVVQILLERISIWRHWLVMCNDRCIFEGATAIPSRN